MMNKNTLISYIRKVRFVFSRARVQQTKNLKIVKMLTLKNLLQSQQSLTLCHQERPTEVVGRENKVILNQAELNFSLKIYA